MESRVSKHNTCRELNRRRLTLGQVPESAIADQLCNFGQKPNGAQLAQAEQMT